MKEALRGNYYDHDEEVKTALMEWLKEQSTEFYDVGKNALIRSKYIGIKINSENI